MIELELYLPHRNSCVRSKYVSYGSEGINEYYMCLIIIEVFNWYKENVFKLKIQVARGLSEVEIDLVPVTEEESLTLKEEMEMSLDE